MLNRLRYLGVASESPFDEQPPPEAALHVDIASASLDVPSEPDLIYEGGLGRSKRVRRPGFYSPSGNIVYAFDIDSIGAFLRYTLGAYKFTAGTPNTHEFWGSGQSLIQSFCARLGKDKLIDGFNFEHVFSGCVAGQLDMAVSDGFAEATVDVVASRDSRADIKEVDDLLLPDSFPLAFHELTVNVAGTDKSALIKSTTITVANNADAEAGRAAGSRHPTKIPVNERETTFEMELFWESIEELQRFWGDDEGPNPAGHADFPIEFLFTAAEGNGSLSIQMPRSWYTQTQQQPAGRDELVQTVTGGALAGDVTLVDGLTVEDTEIYVKLLNDQGDQALI